jgi:hypothetical protein
MPRYLWAQASSPSARKRGRPPKNATSAQIASRVAQEKRVLLGQLDESIKLLAHKTGETMAPAAIRMVLLCMLQLYSDAVCAHHGNYRDISLYSEVYLPIALKCHISVRRAKQIMEAWQQGLEPTLEDPATVAADAADDEPVAYDAAAIEELLVRLAITGRRGPKPLPFRTALVSTGQINIIREFITQRLSSGKATFCRDVRAMLRDLESDPVDVSMAVVKRLLRSMGYVYERRKAITYSPEQKSKRLARIRRFLLQYSRARRDRNVVICYMDESYIHQHHAGLWSYYEKDDPESRLTRKSTKGRRLIIVHAMTADGMMHNMELDVTCEYIFASHTSSGDYHGSMNGDTFMDWVNDYFIPTFQALYPDKKCCLVLDNAPYHHAHDETSVNVNALNKSQLLEVMLRRDINMKSLQFTREVKKERVVHGELVTVTKNVKTTMKINAAWLDSGVPRAPTGPSLDEMRACLQRELEEKHPHLLQTRLQKRFAELRWQLIFTPPYCPELQPIELVWAYGKGHVARVYDTDRQLEQAGEQFRAALYDHIEGLAQLDCSSLVAHCEAEMLRCATSDESFQPHHEDIRCLILVDDDQDDHDQSYPSRMADAALEDELVAHDGSDGEDDEEDV